MSLARLHHAELPTVAAHRWLLAGVMLTVLALGWHYPLLGFVVPLAMLTGMVGGALRGRYVCGNICPRGSFFDTFFARFAPRREIPERLFAMPLRWLIMAGLMSFMVYRLAQNPGSLNHWGLVFWQMCLVTTAAALLLGVLYRPRTWCAICPVGTVANAAGGDKRQLTIADNCRSCKLCETVCPMGHNIADYKNHSAMRDRDCLQCSLCVNACPKGALCIERPGDTSGQAISQPAEEKLKKAA